MENSVQRANSGCLKQHDNYGNNAIYLKIDQNTVDFFAKTSD